MKKMYLIIVLVLVYACSARHENRVEASNPDFNVALKFINDYTNYCNKPAEANLDSNWIKNNRLLTESFKARYKALMDSAYKVEPEIGLDADPIFDAQDYPDNGFVISKSDKNTGFVTVKGKGKNWDRFTVALKVVSQSGKWLVDGAGIINIPNDKREVR
jgi:hypothetical protein